MNAPRTLVAGIGNVFHGDDGFGVEVVARLARRPRPPNVVLMEAGIRGIDLTYALLGDYDAAILIDATSRGRAPGTLYVIEPTLDGAEPPPDALFLDVHGMHPARVLAFLRASGATISRLLVVGCEPAFLGSEDELHVGLSREVELAIEPAITLIESLIARLGSAGDDAPVANAGGSHA